MFDNDAFFEKEMHIYEMINKGLEKDRKVSWADIDININLYKREFLMSRKNEDYLLDEDWVEKSFKEN